MRRIILLTLLVGTIYLALAFPASALAVKLTQQQKSQILSEANELYAQGRNAASSDPAEAKQAFSAAAGKYQTLVDSGVDNGKLYFNLANSQTQAGSLGRAIANYERAAVLLPGNGTIRANLRHARSLLPNSEESEDVQSTFIDIFAKWNSAISLNLRFVVMCVAWSLVWLAAFGYFYFNRFRWSYVMVPALILFILCSMSLGYQFSKMPSKKRGIVVSQAVIREGNGEAFAAKYEQPLSEGDSFDLVKSRENWIQIRTPEGQTGWIPSRDAELIATPT